MALELKVDINGERSTKMRFPMNYTVQETLKDIWTSKIGKSEKDHGIFLPKEGNRKGKAQWLKPERTLRYYDLHDGDTIVYKKKHRVFRYALVDGSQKSVLIDDSDEVDKICQTIAEHIGLKNHLEFGLRYLEDKTGWLDKNLTLHAQDVPEDPMLVLLFAREFFGEPLDQNDPFQLQLNFVQANNSIIEGDYPCTKKEAVLFAALQAQVTFGNHDPTKHVVGWLPKDKFLPGKWRKEKDIDIDIISEHKKLYGMNTQAAKYRYYQAMRALRSFGITFFDGKEIYTVDDKKNKGKSKTKNRDIKLGVSRYEIVLLEAETNEFIHQFDLEKLKSYYALQGVLKLDFGDHYTDIITVATESKPYADRIVQLISGYIELILAVRQDVAKKVEDDDDNVATVDEQDANWMLPQQAAVTTTVGGYNQPAMMPYGNMGFIPRSNQVKVVDLGSAMKATKFLANELGTKKANWQNKGNLTKDQAQNQFLNDKKALAAAVNELLAAVKLDPRGLQRHDMDIRAQQLASQMLSIGAGARALAEFDGSPILDGAKAVADALIDMLNLVNNVLDHPDDIGAIIALGEAEKAMAAAQLLLDAGDPNILADEGSKRLMATAISEVDENMKNLIDNITMLIGKVPDAVTKDRLAIELKKYEATKPWLIKAMAQLMPVILDPKIADEVKRARMGVKDLTDHLVSKVLAVIQLNGLGDQYAVDLNDAAKAVNDALAHLFEATKTAEAKTIEGNLDFATPASMLTNALAQLRTALADPESLVEQKLEIAQGPDVITVAKLLEFTSTEMEKADKKGSDAASVAVDGKAIPIDTLQKFIKAEAKPPTTLRTDPLIQYVKQSARAANGVVSVVKSIAKDADEETSERLVKTGQQLSDGIKELLEESRVLFKDHTNPKLLAKVVAIVDTLEATTQQLITDAGQMSALNDLRFAAKILASNSIVTASFAKKALPTVSDDAARFNLQAAYKKITNVITEYLTDIQLATADPDDFAKQIDLLTASRQRMPDFQLLVNSAKGGAKYINDENIKQDLTMEATKLHESINHLMKAIIAVGDITGQSTIEEALEDFDSVKADLDTAEFAAAHGLLQPIPGQTRENALELLTAGVKTLLKAIEDLTDAASKGEKLPQHISGAAAGISQVAAAVRAVASTVTDRAAQKRIIAAGQAVNVETLNVISVSRVLGVDNTNPQKIDNMKVGKKKFRAALHVLLAAPKGLDAKDINEAKEAIQAAIDDMKEVTKRGYRKGEPEFKEASRALASSTKALSAAVAQYSSMALTNPLALGSSAKMTSLTTTQLLQAAAFAANSSNTEGASKGLIQAGRHLADGLINLLELSKATAATKTPEAVAAFKEAETEVREALGVLIRSLGAASSQESEEAISSIMTLLALLNDEEATNVEKLARQKVLEKFLNASQNMARVTGGIARAAKVSAAKLGQNSKEAVFAVETVIDSARAAAKLANSYTALEGRLLTAARLIAEQPLNTRQVVALSQGVALAGSKLIDEAKAFAASKSKDEKEKERLRSLAVESVKLINAIQRLGSAARISITHEDKDVQELVNIALDVQESVRAIAHLTKKEDELLTFNISNKLTDASRNIAVATTGHIRAATAVTVDDNNELAEQELVKSTEALNLAIQDLVSTIGALNPAVQKCELVSKQLQFFAAELEAAIISEANPAPATPGRKLTLAEYQAKSAELIKVLGQDVNRVNDTAVTGDAEGLAAAATKVDVGMRTVVEMLRFTAGAIEDRDARSNLLEMTKALTEALYALFKAAKTTNPSDRASVDKLQKSSAAVQEVIGRLLNDLASGAQLVSDLEKAAATLREEGKKLTADASSGSKRYAVVRDELNNNTRTLAGEARKILMVDRANAGDVNVTVTAVLNEATKLVKVAQDAIASTSSAPAKKELKAKTDSIVADVAGMIVHLASSVQGNDRSEELKNSFQQVNVDVAELLRAAKTADVAEGIFDEALTKLNGVVQEINTTAIFAQAGQLDPKDFKTEGLTFKGLQDKLSSLVQALGADVAKVVAATKVDDVSSGKASLTVVADMTKVAETAMANAAKLDDKVGQQNLLAATRSAANTLVQLLQDAKAAAQSTSGDTTKEKVLAADEDSLKGQTKEMISILQTAGANMIRGEKELENAKVFVSKLVETATALDGTTPEEVLKAAREVVAVVASLVSANTQDEVIDAAKKTSAATEALVKAVKTAAAKLAPNQEVSAKILDATKSVSASLVAFLEMNKLNRQDEGVPQKIESSSTNVTSALNGLVEALRLLPNAAKLTLEEPVLELVEDHSLENMAEDELRRCAKLIEDAANTLLQAKPRTKPRVEGVVEKEDIDEAILNGVRAIAGATNTLVKASEVTQRERRDIAGKTGAKYHVDANWANGLISAAQAVAGSVQALVKGANGTVQGKAIQGELVAAAHAVAQATAHLVSASKTKSDPDSAAVRNLGGAAKQVANATSRLVEAANQAARLKEQEEEGGVEDYANTNFAILQRKELEQQVKIAGLEAELEKERRKLAAMRKARYKK